MFHEPVCGKGRNQCGRGSGHRVRQAITAGDKAGRKSGAQGQLQTPTIVGAMDSM